MVMVRPIEPTDPALDDWCRLLAEHLRAGAGAAPSGEVLAARARSQSGWSPVRRWAAHLGPAVVGIAQSSPDGDAVFVRLHVAAGHRLRGIGTALLSAVRQAHPGVVLKGMAVAGGAGEPFAAARGATALMRLVVLEHRLADPVPTRAAPPAPASAYRLVFWHDGAPAELVDSYARAYRHLSDAPDFHRQIADFRCDREQLRRREREIRAGGQELWVCAAVADRAVAAFTEVEVGPEPAASQHATVVLPGHRRRGLGSVVKLAMAGRLRALRPDIATVTTTVNEANTPMVALNTQVGYRPVRTRLLLELRPAGSAGVSGV